MGATTIDDVRELGYSAEFAHGSVAEEEAALEKAQRAATPEQVEADAGPLVEKATADFLRIVAGDPYWPPDRQARQIARIQEQIPRMLRQGRDADVELYTRSVAIAGELPDVWAVSGPTIGNVYIATKPDGTGWDDDAQAALDALVDPDAHRERVFQEAIEPAELEAVMALRVARIEEGSEELLAGVVGEVKRGGKWAVHVDGHTVRDLEGLEKLLPDEQEAPR